MMQHQEQETRQTLPKPFASDQWQQITDGLRVIYRPHMGPVQTPDELIEQLKAHLEQREGDNPSHERTVQALPR